MPIEVDLSIKALALGIILYGFAWLSWPRKANNKKPK